MRTKYIMEYRMKVKYIKKCIMKCTITVKYIIFLMTAKYIDIMYEKM